MGRQQRQRFLHLHFKCKADVLCSQIKYNGPVFLFVEGDVVNLFRHVGIDVSTLCL